MCGLQGRWEETEQLHTRATENCNTKFGENRSETLRSIGQMAETYRNQGRWEEAEQLEVQVMETYKTKLGDDHYDTLSSMCQDRFDEAEQLLLHVAEAYKTKLATTIPTRGLGRLEEAEQLAVQVMQKRKTKLWNDHPYTLRAARNLARILETSGKTADSFNITP
ncbi:unnamed protein product [Penicillium glandicola]